MKVIGYANKFYTLWEVSKEVRYTGTEGNYMPYEVGVYTYYQNLSTDRTKAILKAEKMGLGTLEVDKELYGRNRSWTSAPKKLYTELPKELDTCFSFGKYSNKIINDCKDLSYLQWYFNETKNRYALALLLANGYELLEDYMYTSEEAQKVREKIAFNKIAIKGAHYNNGDKVELNLKEVKRYSDTGRYGVVYNITYIADDNKIFKYVGSKPTDIGNEFTTVKATIKHKTNTNGWGEDTDTETRLLRIKKI
mgnify:CR=1 FL=1|tara:strand:- start:3817 stop:4569 length:753 start_codon:yes stop_codon:yes gene_type:complete